MPSVSPLAGCRCSWLPAKQRPSGLTDRLLPLAHSHVNRQVRAEAAQTQAQTAAAPAEPATSLPQQPSQIPNRISFVDVFRSAAPYVQSHRNQTVVICLPSEIMLDKQLLTSVLDDIVLLHGMSLRLVLVLGVRHQIDAILATKGLQPHFVNGFRVTDMDTMTAAAEATGAARVVVEAALSKALSAPMLRRHTRSNDRLRHGPALEVVYGNWINGRRRGVIDGVDYGYTGRVRSLNSSAISSQLQAGHIVLLTSLAYSLAGEVLNCNVFDIATHAAVELNADKLIIMSDEDLQQQGIPPWLPLSDAVDLLQEGAEIVALESFEDDPAEQLCGFEDDPTEAQCSTAPNSLLSAVRACKHGVKRSHVIYAHVPGALIVELYSRDGLGVMVSGDFFEGVREAGPQDVDAIMRMYQKLRMDGLVRPHCINEDFDRAAQRVFIIEREGEVLGCAVIQFIGTAADGHPCAELAAFCVSPKYRGAGRTDSLLDFLEQTAREAGTRRLVFVTTAAVASSPDWFVVHGFEDMGPTQENLQLLPPQRADKVQPAQCTRLFVKEILPPDAASSSTPVGKRIGI